MHASSIFFFFLSSPFTIFALPHVKRSVGTAPVIVDPCPGAPPLPPGSVGGGHCVTSNNTSTPPAPRAIAPRQSGGFSACQTVSLADYNSSPMKQGIEAQATKNWGGDFQVAINPPDFPDQKIQFCYTTDTVAATFKSPPQCTTSSNGIQGHAGNASTDVTVSLNQGTTSTHQVSVEAAVSLSTATSIGITLGVPEVAEATVTETVTLTGTFTKGDTKTDTINQQAIQTVTAHATKPGPCQVQLNVTQCTAEATATVPGFYTGFVWFNYGHTVDGHFKWAINVDAALPADQRSSNMSLTDKVNSNTAGHFDSQCN